MKRIFVDLANLAGGLGDAVIRIPALRALRKRHPYDEIVGVGWFDNTCIFAHCDYIDYYLPVDFVDEDWMSAYCLTQEERYYKCDTARLSLNFHDEHIVKSNIRQLLFDSPDNEPLDLELSIRNCDIEIINELQKNLLEKANGKKIVAICPAVTCYSRMWPATRWQELTNILRENGYFVVSVGSKEDLDINVDFDARGVYEVHHIPKILEIFDTIFLISSGMICVAAINQDVHIVKIEIGQFNSKQHTPYRHGELEYNTTIVNHNCPFVRKCFLGEATNVEKQSQMSDLLNRWQAENNIDNVDLNQENITKLYNYIQWNYCYKSNDKFLCATISAEDVFNAFKQKKSIVASMQTTPLPVYHERKSKIKDDYAQWLKIITHKQQQGKILLAIKSNLDIETILDKIIITKKLYPDRLLIIICKKEYISQLKNCKDVFHSIPIEYLSGQLRIGQLDVFLSI
jgi:hypothetical protein